MGSFFLILPMLLGLVVVLVNGFTDAPNAIATAVTVKALSLKNACLLCGLFNFLGAFVFSTLSGHIIDTVFTIINLNSRSESYTCIVCGLLTTIAFGIVAWIFKMPSSESHALLCSLLGASFFLGSKANLFVKGAYLILCMAFSCALSYFLSILIGKSFVVKYKSSMRVLKINLCLTSFMHGAQDGQKFVGALMFLGKFADTYSSIFSKTTICLLVSLFMMLGSLLGGKRIIDTLGGGATSLNYQSAITSDFSSISSMLFCSLFGLPVSTGNIRIFSIIGGGVSLKQPINKKTAGYVLLVSILTLPICFLVGYFLAYLFSFASLPLN